MDAATIVPLSAVDAPLVEALLDAAFGTARRARTAYRIRRRAPLLDAVSFAVLDEDEYLAGTMQAWATALIDPAGRPHPLIMVGPVAVMPGRQGEGFGKALMGACLGAIDAGFDDGAPPLPQVMIGDPDYYGRWDFTARHTGGWTCPGPFEPERLLVRTGNPAILPAEGMLGPWPSGDAKNDARPGAEV